MIDGDESTPRLHDLQEKCVAMEPPAASCTSDYSRTAYSGRITSIASSGDQTIQVTATTRDRKSGPFNIWFFKRRIKQLKYFKNTDAQKICHRRNFDIMETVQE